MSKETPIYDEATELLRRAQRFNRETLVGVDKADWRPKLEYPNLPFAVGLFTDIHYGSIYTNYDLLDQHLGIVEDTPNFGMVTNGDDVDNFIVAGKAATGTYEDPLPPQLQTVALIDKLGHLAKIGKLGAMSYGNHNNFTFITGYDWLETWSRQLGKKIPIFTAGGELIVHVGKEKYDLAMSHKYWGVSKLNPTNANKRFLEYEYPDADISFLAHTHQSEMNIFERGGKERIAAIGGTYKEGEPWPRQQGIGRRAGQPGLTVLLWPNEHKMMGFKHSVDAQQFMLALIYREETTKSGIIFER
jgi:hypothetical protein